MGGSDTLMITNGGYMPQGDYGGIPNPYQQQAAGYGGGFVQPNAFGGGGMLGGFGAAPMGGMGGGGFNNNGFQQNGSSGW